MPHLLVAGLSCLKQQKNSGFKFIPFEARGILKTQGGDSQNVIGGRLF